MLCNVREATSEEVSRGFCYFSVMRCVEVAHGDDVYTSVPLIVGR